MVLVREHDEFGRYTHHLSRIEGSHAFVHRDAEVRAAVDAEDGRVPVLHQLVRGVGVVAHGGGLVAPGRAGLLQAAKGDTVAGGPHLPFLVGVFVGNAAIVPVGEPHFFRSHVHVLLVEDTGVRDEAVVHIPVDTGQVVNAIAAIGGAAGRHAAHIRFRLDVTGCREVILHVQANVVAGDFLAPGLAKSRGTAAVREHHHIALMAHEQVVPAVAPALRERPLRAAQANLDGRVGLGGVELRREQHPGEHLLPVHSIQPAGLGFVRIQLGKEVLVLKA